MAAANVSGAISVLGVSLVDSDTNDPLQTQRASNNSIPSAQVAGNPALIVGYVNQPGAGPAGPNRTAGDEWDAYRVDLVAGQLVELNFGDSSAADVDLYIYDSTNTEVGQSVGVTRSECLRVTRAGTYVVAVQAYDGASAYELTLGPPRPGSACANSTSSVAGSSPFVAHELIAKPRADAADAGALRKPGAELSYLKATSLLDGLGLSRKAGSSAGEAMLLAWPDDGDDLRKLNSGLAAMRAKAGGASLMKAGLPTPLDGISDDARRGFETTVAAKQLAASGAFEYVELNTWKDAHQAAFGTWPPNDEYLSRQPHYGLIDLPAAFNALASVQPRPGYVPIVAVVDTGIVADHPDLSRMLVPGFDFVSNATNGGDGNGLDANPNDEAVSGGSFHGTHVAGTIAAEAFNGRGVVGVAPMARVMPVRGLGVGGRGSLFDILQGVRFAAGLSNSSGTLPARRADVINLSLGGSGACSSAEADAMNAARQQGVIVVAAAGNEAAPVGSPANCAGVIAVSAVSYDLRLASYSNSGPQIAIAAPGGDQSRSSPAGADLIMSTYAGFVNGARRSGYIGLEGTSMASPHVAGVMALMKAVNPSLTPAQVDSLLASGALTNELGAAGRDSSFGFGLVNALKAVQAAAGSGTTPTPVPDLPTLAVSPSVLDFGGSLTELTVTVSRINGSTDTPASYRTSALDATAVTVSEPQAGNPPGGPFRLVVGVNRARLAPGENVVRVEVTSAQNRVVNFDVSMAARTTAPSAQRGVGPVYVLAVDVNTLDNVGQAEVTTVGLVYNYTITGLTAAQVVIVAGTDTDNDGYVCGASEPCGAYPVLGGQPTVLELAAGNRNGIDFELVSGGSSAASLGFGQAASMPAAGPPPGRSQGGLAPSGGSERSERGGTGFRRIRP